MLSWSCYEFDKLNTSQLYEICRVRYEVFVVEQDCVYQDLDGIDQACWHLCGWQLEGGTRELVAYLRLVPPGLRFRQPSLGRILTTRAARGTGVGRELLRRGLDFSEQQYPHQGNKIAAQAYLEKFYSGFGFKAVSDVYLEDDIPHIDMLKDAQ